MFGMPDKPKQEKTPVVFLRVTYTMSKKIKWAAKRCKMSMNEWCIDVLAKQLKKTHVVEAMEEEEEEKLRTEAERLRSEVENLRVASDEILVEMEVRRAELEARTYEAMCKMSLALGSKPPRDP